MRKKALLLLCLAAVVGVTGIAYGVWRRPRPLLTSDGNCQIIRVGIMDRARAADSLVDVDGYDAQALLNCLSGCMVRRTLEWDGRYQEDDLDLMIVVLSPNGGGFTFLLWGSGRNNYAQDSNGRYTIENAAALKADLLEILARSGLA